MDDTLLLSAIENAEETAYGRSNDELSTDREEAINFYLGKPYGNEVEGQSQIVSRDTMDTIEWIKPSILRIFTGGDEVVRFDPVGPEDEEAAKQESDYVNHIVQQKNNWFHIFLTWISDAMLTKNAYAMAFWDEKEDTTKERYQGLTEDQLALLGQDETVEIVAAEAYPAPVPPEIAMLAQQTGQQLPMLHNVELMKKKNYGCVKIEVLPPERCLVAQSTKGVSVRDSDFFEYWELKSISDLRSMGFDVDDSISDSGGPEFTLEDNARDQYAERAQVNDFDSPDPTMRKVRVRMAWIKHDYDQDGLAEYRYVVIVGKTILANEECSGIPVACIVPTPLPHRHPGMSVADMVMDIQFIQSMIQRQILNNLYLSNNPRTAISDKVNLDDMLTSRVGGVVRVDGIPQQHLMPLVVPNMGPQALPIVEFFNQIKENRTGTNRYFSGTDEGSLNKTATGIAQLTSSAAQRVEMIARIFAEGVKELFAIVHELTLKHARQPDVVRLRNEWVTVDPRQWKKRTDMTLAVGLGTGNKEVVAANLGKIFQAQMVSLPLGVGSPEGVRETVLEMTKAYGFPSPEKFWPEKTQQPPMDPEKLEKAMQELQQKEQAIQQEGKKVEQGKQALQEQAHTIEQKGAQLQVKEIAMSADQTTQIELIRQEGEDRRKRMELESKERIAAADFELRAREIEQRRQAANRPEPSPAG